MTRSAKIAGRRGRSQLDPLHHRRGARPDGEHLAVGELGQHPQRQPARLLGEPARQLGRQRVPRLAGRVAAADQRRDPAARQPPADQPRPPLGRGPPGPHVELLGRQPRGRAVGLGCPRRSGRPTAPPRRCRAAPASSTWSSRATALRSRTASPPLRSTLGGCTPQWSSSSSTRRTTSKAAPAAVRATSAGSRAAVASPGTSSTGSVVVRPPRRASPTSPGSTTVSPSRGTSSRRLISSSAGLAACSGETVRRAEPVVPSPPWASTCRSSAVAAGLSPASSAATSSGPGGSGLDGRRPLTRPGHPAHRVGDAAQRADPSGRLPGQREVEQPLERGGRAVGVGVHDRDQVPPKWFDLQPTGHQARKVPDGPGRRGRGGSTSAWRPARRAATNLEGREWRDLDGPAGAPRVARPASSAAGRRGFVRVSPAHDWTSLLRYSPGRCRRPTSRDGTERVGHEER